jgi:hypothetical protein
MEDLKLFENLLEPDERWKYFVLRNVETGEMTPSSLAHRYEIVAPIRVNGSAPEDVRSQFNVAKMLCVYAWLYYPFHQVAELKAFSTVEMALRLKYPTIKGMLYKLLAHAINEGDIKDSAFSHIEASPEDPLRYTRQLPDLIPSLRNSLAHGGATLHPGSVFTLRNCSEIINQLYPLPGRVPA